MFLIAVFGLVLIASSLQAFEAVGTLKKIDAEKGQMVITGPGGQDHTVKIARDIKILGMDNKPLPDGLKAKELKEGTVVTVTVEQEDGTPTLKAIRLGGRPGAGAPETQGIFKKVDAEKNSISLAFGGQERTFKIAKDIKILGMDNKPLPDGLKAKELKDGATVRITTEQVDGERVVKTIRLGQPMREFKEIGKPSFGLKPLTEMTASDKYKGEDGGLYGSGKNEPPDAHQAAAKKETAKIVPLDAEGKPAKDGKIVLVSISMSNATQEFSHFKRIADRDEEKSPLLTIVDCAQGGMTMIRWANPKGQPWDVAAERLEKAGVTPEQVQIAWIKLANAGPKGDLSEHGKKLQQDTVTVLHNLKERFPNLRIAYLGSRIYGGWANTQLNPEPYAYEGAFPVRWLIQDQIKGDAELNYDPSRGAVKSPLLLWGPYFWGDGLTPRKSDGLVWKREDLGPDGTHPNQNGVQKVADMLLKFFKTDSLARTWFVKE